MITGMYLHDPSPFNGPFFMTPPFSGSQKVVTLLLFPSPLPLLISDKSLMAARLLSDGAKLRLAYLESEASHIG